MRPSLIRGQRQTDCCRIPCTVFLAAVDSATSVWLVPRHTAFASSHDHRIEAIGHRGSFFNTNGERLVPSRDNTFRYYLVYLSVFFRQLSPCSVNGTQPKLATCLEVCVIAKCPKTQNLGYLPPKNRRSRRNLAAALTERNTNLQTGVT